MGTISPESTAELINDKFNNLNDKNGLTNSCDELESLRAARQQAELKFQLLRKRFEEELTFFSETRVEHIFKNSGALDYFERLKARTKTQEDIIKNLREDLEYKTKEVLQLQTRSKELERQGQEYLKAWKEAQAARETLELEKKMYFQSQQTKERKSAVSHPMSNSPSSSLVIENQVPPPPLIDAPSIEEIIRSTSCTRDPNPYNSLDKSIPPPPNIEVPLDEILQDSGRSKAFEQEKGQFLCHAYLSIQDESCQETLSDIVELIEAEQARSSSRAFEGWIGHSGKVNVFERNDFHLTLVRGHRAIYYHQIKPLVGALETYCKNLQPLNPNICLDTLQIFHNNEKTKQFLCMTTQIKEPSEEPNDFQNFKSGLKEVIDQFAERLTTEDETEDTRPHCSIMFREMQQVQDDSEVEKDLHNIEALCSENLDEYPICLVTIGNICLKIGKEVYSFRV